MDDVTGTHTDALVTVIVRGDDAAGRGVTLASVERQTLSAPVVCAESLEGTATPFVVELQTGEELTPTALERLVWALASRPHAGAAIVLQSSKMEQHAVLQHAGASELLFGARPVRAIAYRTAALRQTGGSGATAADSEPLRQLVSKGWSLLELTGDYLVAGSGRASTGSAEADAARPQPQPGVRSRLRAKLELDGLAGGGPMGPVERLARLAPDRIKGRAWRRLGLPVRADRWRPALPLLPRPQGLPAAPAPTDARNRVLILHPYLIAGGAESLVLNLLTYADRDLVEMHLITTDPTPGTPGDSPWLRRFSAQADHLFQLHGFLAPEHHLRFVIDYINTRRIDVVLISLSVFGYNALPALRAHCPGASFVDVIHAEAPYEPMDHIRLASRYRALLDRRVVTTESVRIAQCERYGESCERIEVISNGIDTMEAFDPERYAQEAFRQRTGVPDGAALVLFFGRLVAEKQPEHVLEMAKRLKGRTDIVFAIVGDGPLRPAIEAAITAERLDNVRLCPPEPNIADALAAARIAVFPSKREGLPMAGIESLSMGVPVVAGRVPGWSDLIDDGRTGVLIDDGDFDGYARAIERFVDDAGERERVSQAARDSARTAYDARECARRWVSLFERMADAQAAPAPRLSIIIVAYDSAGVLPQCLASVREHAPRLPYEVVCVDNGSADDTREVLARDFGWVRVVEAPGNLGFAGGNLLGMQHARGDLLLLLNPDTVVLPAAIDALVDALLAEESRAIAGACLLDEGGDPVTSWGDFPTLGWAIANTAPWGRIGVRARPGVRMDGTCAGMTGVTAVDWVSGAALAVRRSTWNDLGGMDPGFFLYYEETDLCFRARQAGLEVVTVPGARVVHLEGAIVGTQSVRQYVWSTRSLLRFLRRNRGALAAAVASHWVFEANLILWLVATVAGPFSAHLRERRPRYDALLRVGLGRRTQYDPPEVTE